ncbi:MAG: DUF4912 domain-containing protein [Nodosilinea sp.]
MQYSVKLLVAALFALSPAAHPALRDFALAQVTPAFSLPETVPAGTTLSIQSSPNLGFAADALKQEFEATYEGTEVGVELTSSDQAIADLIAGTVDLVAIGRPLTEAEQAAGLTTVSLERAKIAIITGTDNPFDGNLTFEQFAGMFRGDITDWAEVGGAPGPIRFVDRPDISDTRRSLSQYDVFSSAPFEAGPTTETVAEDDTAAVIQALGDDGIGYAIAPHVIDQPAVNIVPMHQTLPDDPRYPYSQPRYFVYQGEPNPAVAAFLGYATSPAGLAALTAAQVAEVGAVAEGVTAPVDPVAEATPGTAPVDTAPDADPDAVAPVPVETVPVTENNGGFAWWWLLLPLAALGGLAWLLSRGRGGMTPDAETAVAPPAGAEPIVPPPTAEHPVPPPVEPPVADTPAPPPLVLDKPIEAGVPAPPVVEPPSPAPEDVAPESEPEIISPAPEIITVEEVPPTAEPVVELEAPKPKPTAVPAAMGMAGLAAGAAASLASTEDQSAVEASKYNVVGRPADGDIDLSTIDDGLPPLPDGYGESRIVLMPRDPQWAYAYWDTPHTHKEDLRRQGGESLALRLYDVTGINLDSQAPHSMQQVGCDELARQWYMQIPVSDRDYQVEIGYLAGDGRWLVLARSNTVRIPPVYPSDWTEEHFLTVTWEESLRSKTLMTLVDPRLKEAGAEGGLHQQLYALAQGGEALRVDGSLFGSMQHVAGSMAPPISSYTFASGAGLGAGLGAAAGVPGLTMSGVSGLTMSGFPGIAEFSGLTMSGVSGLTLSGVGFSASMPPIRPRKFWLVADAELIVYGATEPDATVTIGGTPIQLSEDGTFRFQTSFQDGTIEYPIMAVAADGEQSRNIHMTFERQTPDRRTNTKDDAQEEWPEV